MKRAVRLGYIIAFGLIGWSHWSFAMDDSSRAAARTLVNEGAAEYAAGKYEASLKKFSEALEVAKVPTVAVWAAQANEKLGKLVSAAELYEQALLMQPNDLWVGNAQEEAQAKARDTLTRLRPRIPTVKIQVEGQSAGDLEITIDSVRVPSSLLLLERPLDPGAHTIAARQGNKSASQSVTLAESQKQTVTLQLAETGAIEPAVASSSVMTAPPPEGTAHGSNTKWQRTVGWVGIGVGAAGVAFGATMGILAGIERSSLHDDGCSANTCPGSSYKSRIDSYNSMRTLSTVGFVVGGVAAAAGVTFLLTSPKQESSPKVGLVVSPGAIQLAGHF